MKNLLRRRFLPAILCMGLALGLSACGGKDTPFVETETDGAMGTLSGSKGEKDSGVGVFSGSGEEIAEAELAEESLNLLYDVMAYDDRYAGAVAYLGYRKQGDSAPLSDWPVENCAGLVEAMPFLLNTPAEHILGPGYGDLFCIVPTGENYLPMLMDFGIWGYVTGLDYPEDWEPSGDDWWLPPTDWGLAYTNWTCEHWYVEFGWGDSDPDHSGRIDLYHQPEDGQEYAYSYSGIWRMEGDCLYLDLSDGAGTRMSGSFPVLIDPSGESLHIQQDRETGVCPLFFGEGMTCMDLIRAYG